MPIKLGIHTGPQDLSMAELHRLWKRADEAGFHAEYMEAGADGLNIPFRPPLDWDAIEAYIERVLPVFHQSV